MRSLFRPVLGRLREEILLLVLLTTLLPLLWWVRASPADIHSMIDWKTLGALAGLMILSQGLEDSGYLARAGQWVLLQASSTRLLAVLMVLFSALLAAIITNDVALFIVVPLTLALGRSAHLPVGRLVIFEALAVNAGSTLSPIGNPQNLFLWQANPISFIEFLMAMLPLGAGLVLLVLILIPLAFPSARIQLRPATATPTLNRPLYRLSLLCYPLFLLLTDAGLAVPGALALLLVFLVSYRAVLQRVDWLLLAMFLLMFINLGLLARIPALSTPVETLLALPGGAFSAGVVVSQLMSNVPATLFLSGFTDDWRLLAWGVNVGSFGLALGSLANLIAFRLAAVPGIWREFHRWSLPLLGAGCLLAALLLALLP